jgi:hypothetical protein
MAKQNLHALFQLSDGFRDREGLDALRKLIYIGPQLVHLST